MKKCCLYFHLNENCFCLFSFAAFRGNGNPGQMCVACNKWKLHKFNKCKYVGIKDNFKYRCRHPHSTYTRAAHTTARTYAFELVAFVSLSSNVKRMTTKSDTNQLYVS